MPWHTQDPHAAHQCATTQWVKTPGLEYNNKLKLFPIETKQKKLWKSLYQGLLLIKKKLFGFIYIQGD